MALPEYDLPFNAMGCGIRVLVGPSTRPSGTPAEAEAGAVRASIERFDQSLSRFNSGSELSRLNTDPNETVPASPLLRSLVSAAIWAAEQSDGLLDPTLVGELEEVGYLETFRNATPAPLAEALLCAPPARPAAARRDSIWREIYVDHNAGTVTRPVGVRIDSGGVGKGLVADAAAAMLTDRERFCVNAAGDMRIGGPDASIDPYRVTIEDPFGGDHLVVIKVGHGAVATSGIGSRIWKTDYGYAHHLLDPSTGQPAWTGIVQATAMAPTALEAETRAKQVLLGGPKATSILELDGGVALLDDGTVELYGPVATAMERRHLRLVHPSNADAA
ncbi:MAG: FAD:protein FMN transferase [Solirubrobacterales bacterium]|nr:FAD:protein FMN transferase [Solirubrobacterales bacterium]